MFHLSFSNRFEILLDTLLERLGAEQPGPFGQRQVVVPSSALRRVVELAVADREGVSANLRFDYLAQWLWQQIGRVVPVAERSPFSPTLLAWRIHGLLDRAHEHGAWVAAHPRLARYLDGADARMRFELAGRIARVFDHYLTYRPQWLAVWAHGRGSALGPGASAVQLADEAWQAELWQRIRDGMGLRQEHPAQAFLRRVTAMSADELAAVGLPATVHVFALPALPPLYLDLLRELARVVDVRLYVLNPCREFWFDIVDARRLSWLAAQQKDMFFDTGNGLLAAWGKQTRAHIGLLFEGEHAVEEDAAFAPHPGRHLLARLHNAILALEELPPAGVRLAGSDRSLEVHVCHSRTRELEVLHDRLLGLFKMHAGTDAALRPADVVVLTPDLETTAPLIEAVFGTAPAARRIPWRITGLGGTRDNPVARVLDQALHLAASRFPASRVFDLLQQAPVAARFGLDDAALEAVHDWLRSAGVCWGLDAVSSAATGPVAGTAAADAGARTEAGSASAHTLDEGLHRLFLAWAAGEAADQASFAGRIGAGAPEGQAASALGSLWRYADSLRSVRDLLLREHTGAGWRSALNEVLDRLVGDPAEHADALREVRAAIAALADDIAAAELEAAVPLAVVHPALAAVLDDPARGGVPGGTVTFSALPALRSLPYRVVCVIGLDQGAFPGSDGPAEFDLMAARPQAGDRQRRLDDRNLFLDLILSAREVLHLSYVGRSVRDGSALPPSVLVDELLDTLATACASTAGDPAALAEVRRRLTVIHPLQAFAADYFIAGARRDERLTSFNEDYAQALASRLAASAGAGGAGAAVASAAAPSVAAQAQSLLREPGAAEGESDADDADARSGADAAPFFVAPLPPPDAAWREVELLQLIRFFANPCRYLLRERVGLDLPHSAEVLDDVEPMLPDWAGQRALAARLLPVMLADAMPAPKGRAGELDESKAGVAPAVEALEPGAGAAHDRLWALARAGNEYPAGTLGEAALVREFESLLAFSGRQRQLLAAPAQPPHRARFECCIDGEAWSLTASFADLRADGLLRARYDDTRASDYLGAWLAHLLLCAAPAPGVRGETRGLSRDGEFRFAALDPAVAGQVLETLLGLYRQGLCAPLHFFPKSAWAYVKNSDSPRKAMEKWTGGMRTEYGEGNDPAYRLALRGVAEPLDETFFTLAEKVFVPLVESILDERLS
ncbi:exodeoxyribonuclease V subunit gamma [Thauera sp.]|jgi:exodeoxyribonuclease V gamma subunit|uniref:exodeoxyribonuclease V subunit gamma n=1 Tax=Thauera sp. TaxID=1905334 RepID=UPI002A35971C|nr:exodeoxyribonuclease V subunit gamma [Thauera sp.]MDX9884643.1 exodeoxyribonuclease V subunit gamma [Thauera sp.]